MQFQPALDAYIAGGQGRQGGQGQGDLDRADDELAEAIQWNERCPFPFDNFLPVFHLARSRGLPLLAMGVDRCVRAKRPGGKGGGWVGREACLRMCFFFCV